MTRAAQLADARRCLKEARTRLAALIAERDAHPSALADLRVFHASRAVDLWAADVSHLAALVKP